MADFTFINNKRHLDIAIAALTHVNTSIFIKLVRAYLKYQSKKCDKHIDPDWALSHKGLIAGDWKHFKNKENNDAENNE